MDTLQKYVEAKAVVTIIDGDDWRWIYLGDKLIYEGHADMNRDILSTLFTAIFGEDNFVVQYEWIDGELAEEMCYNANNLPDIQEKFGHEPEDILIYW